VPGTEATSWPYMSSKSPAKKEKKSKSRSRSSSRSSSSRSRSRSSGSRSSSRSSSSRSPSRRRSRGSRTPPRRSRSPRKKERAPSPLPTKLHVGNLTRNVNEEHLKEIFGNWGKLKRVELVFDRKTVQSKGFAYLEFEANEEAVEAMARMDGAQIDGNVISVQYTLPRAKRSPRPWRRPDFPRGRGGFGGGRFRRVRSPPRRFGGRPRFGGRRWSPPRGGRRSRSRSPLRRRRSPSRSRSASPDKAKKGASRSPSPSRKRRTSRSPSSRSRS